MSRDLNDVLMQDGLDAGRKLLDSAEKYVPPATPSDNVVTFGGKPIKVDPGDCQPTEKKRQNP
jgi:hypothetical protein